MREMNSSFKMQFKDFNEALAQLKKAQKDNTDYTTSSVSDHERAAK